MSFCAQAFEKRLLIESIFDLKKYQDLKFDFTGWSHKCHTFCAKYQFKYYVVMGALCLYMIKNMNLDMNFNFMY